MSDLTPKISVIMPLNDSAHIIQVGLYSLASQVNAPPWELIVMDNEIGHLHEGFFDQHMASLEDAGCVRLSINIVPTGTSFCRKFGLSARLVAESSRVVVFQCDDDYIGDNLFRQIYEEHIGFGFGTTYDRWGHFVNIETGQAMLFDQREYGKPYGLMQRFRADLFRNLPLEDGKWPDAWLWEKMGNKDTGPLIFENDPNSSVYLNHGRNVSKGRAKFYDNPVPPYSRVSIDEIQIPDQIRNMINRQ